MQANQPFFSNDLAGTLKVIGIFGTMLATTIGFVVKLTTSKYSDDTKTLKIDLDNIGKKVDNIDKSCIEQTAKNNIFAARLERHDAVQEQILREQGKQEATLASVEKQNTQLQIDLMSLISENSRIHQKEESELKVNVGRLQERLETVNLVRELLDGRKNNQ